MNTELFAKMLTAMTYDGPRYIRKSEQDVRICRGDDYAGNAWLDTLTGLIVWVAVGYDPNEEE